MAHFNMTWYNLQKPITDHYVLLNDSVAPNVPLYNSVPPNVPLNDSVPPNVIFS
jgi:hypothetical protein